MALLSALISLLGRQASRLLRAIFGWSTLALFGRLPAAKETALSVALILSLLWPVLVIGIVFPSVAAWALAFVPLHQWLGRTALRWMWLALAIVFPLIVGGIIRWITPEHKLPEGRLQTLLSGYALTLGFAISFLIACIVVPILRLNALRKGWSDEHVYLQPNEGQYEQVLGQIAKVCQQTKVPVRIRPVPFVMGLSTRTIKWFARGGLDPLVADDPRLLQGKDIQISLYPSDLLLQGRPELVARLRAALIRSLLHAPAHLTSDEKAQALEDDIHRLWGVVERHRPPLQLGPSAVSRLKEITNDLYQSSLPFEDFVLLYTNLHLLERAVCQGPHLVDPPAIAPSVPEVNMQITDRSVSQTPVSELVKEVLNDAQQLVRLEVALAKEELRDEIAAAKSSAIAFGVCALAAILGLSMLLMALALTIAVGPVPALIIGAVLLAIAGAAGFVGYKTLPKKPLQETQKRVETDVKLFKEHVA